MLSLMQHVCTSVMFHPRNLWPMFDACLIFVIRALQSSTGGQHDGDNNESRRDQPTYLTIIDPSTGRSPIGSS